MEWDFSLSIDESKIEIIKTISEIYYISDDNIKHFIDLVVNIEQTTLNENDILMLIDSDLTSLSINIINKPANLKTYKLINLYCSNKVNNNVSIIVGCISMLTLFGFILIKNLKTRYV